MANIDPALVRVDQLRLTYHTPSGVVCAVEDASLEVRAGEAVGLVGESGSGKSSLARAVLGLLPPHVARIDGGKIAIAGRDVTHASEREWERLRGHPVAIVFQDPLSYLNPVMRIGRQITESVERHDPRRSEADTKTRVTELLDLVKLPSSCIRAYPHELSGGMRQRALLAMALGCRPRLLVADEPTTALDVTTQAEILALLDELRQRFGMALLLISHDLAVVAAACERVYIMYAGRTVERGDRRAVFSRPAHPYTSGLLQAAVAARDAQGRFVTIEGDVPKLTSQTTGCPFTARCDLATEQCASEMPPYFDRGDGPEHRVRCWVSPSEKRSES